MEASLRGIRVLVTRAGKGGGDLATLLEGRGAQVRSIPLIRIGPPPSERELQAAVDAADAYDWLIFTSANGVQNFCARRKAPLARETRVAAVGSTTAAAVRDHSPVSDIVQPAHFIAEALADEVLRRAQPASSALVVQAADARPVLAARLRAGGMEVKTIAAYTTVAVPPDDLMLRLKDCDVITLASASAARALVQGLGGAVRAALHVRGKLIACIGPVTEHEARVQGLHVELVAPASTAQSFVDSLCAYYSGSQS